MSSYRLDEATVDKQTGCIAVQYHVNVKSLVKLH